ncbi:porin family protein [Halomonas sp. McH1-25]|uniref:porin family protein n=1 Tax=unclassified Halomonas TaxID=2609666 RepID=UPI001EF4D6BD|nr:MULTISPECIES: porin family protein [unclassified Halomonas]MCG7602097.1 porin family protein [Halomonas sp. McH1-25]MCP1343013.1 porin family protein [Halomonas sp. FL8]MCP1362435.1 porin family protein [Halomonas sp. BBD45]MCP1364093.1 porin family protein [Halomonas sp. BBD48]
MKQTTLLAGLAAAISLFTLSGVAQAVGLDGLYFGLDAQQWQLEYDGLDDEYKDTTARIRLGYDVSRYFGIEAQLSGGGSDTLTYGPLSDELELDYLAGLYLKGVLPVNSDFQIYALAGVSHAKATETLTYGNATYRASDRDSNPGIGLGVEIDVNELFSLNADIMRHSIGATDYDLDTFAGGFNYHW